jgi:hypothetical protein
LKTYIAGAFTSVYRPKSQQANKHASYVENHRSRPKINKSESPHWYLDIILMTSFLEHKRKGPQVNFDITDVPPASESSSDPYWLAVVSKATPLRILLEISNPAQVRGQLEDADSTLTDAELDGTSQNMQE